METEARGTANAALIIALQIFTCLDEGGRTRVQAGLREMEKSLRAANNRLADDARFAADILSSVVGTGEVVPFPERPKD